MLLRYISISLAGLILFFAASVYAGQEDVKEGMPLPIFTLMNDEGERVSMESYLDRPTVVYFTHNACHYCTQIIAMLKRAQEKFGEERLGVIGVNVMAKDTKLVRAYKEELGFVFPMLAGNRSEVIRAFKIHYVPKLVFVDEQKLVRKVVGHYIHEPELHDNIREIMRGSKAQRHRGTE